MKEVQLSKVEDWDKYKLYADLYKFYADSAIKVLTLYYAALGGFLSYYLSKNTAISKWILVIAVAITWLMGEIFDQLVLSADGLKKQMDVLNEKLQLYENQFLDVEREVFKHRGFNVYLYMILFVIPGLLFYLFFMHRVWTEGVVWSEVPDKQVWLQIVLGVIMAALLFLSYHRGKIKSKSDNVHTIGPYLNSRS